MSDALRLYDLLAPQFLAGFKFSESFDKILSKLTVTDLQSTSDTKSILYTGTVKIPEDQTTQHSSGAFFDWKKGELQFRLRIPRGGSEGIKGIVDKLPSAPPGVDVLNLLGTPPSEGSDYPGLRFRLELLLNFLTFHLGESWKPATFDADLRVVKNSNFKRDGVISSDVRIYGPKMLFRYDQGEDFDESTDFEVAAWGDPGFDAPNDLCEGELATMDPPLAIHESERIAFGVDEIILDLSKDNTPTEILEQFGTDDSFEGLYVKALQVYYADKEKDLALNFVVRDALISFSGEVSFEAELDLVLAGVAKPNVEIQFLDGNKKLPFNWGKITGENSWSGGSASITPSTILRFQVTGGPASYTPKVTFKPETGTSSELWNSTNNLAQFNSLLLTQTGTLSGTLTVSIRDSNLAEIYSNTLALKITGTGQTSSPEATPLLPQYVPSSSNKPPFIRKLSIHFRIRRNDPVLIEISGEVDFKSGTGYYLRELKPDFVSSYPDYNRLDVIKNPSATANPYLNKNDGIVDFFLNVTYDTATRSLSETFRFGAAPGDKDGLAYITNLTSSTTIYLLKNILGAELILTPILSKVTEAVAPEHAGDWTAISIESGVPIALGTTGWMNTTMIIFYGGELKLRQDIGGDPKFTEFAITCDYEVSFGVNISSKIQSKKPLKVRYKAVGINMNFDGGTAFKVVFDTSKGYKLDLSDPGLFDVGDTLGKILKIAAARIARVNPTTLEFDLVLNANLGVITVDKFQIKVFLEDNPPTFTILPSGIKVNIPGTLKGSGSINIGNDESGKAKISGSIDLTLVPLKLRIAADVVVDHVTQTPREATAIYASMSVDFPSPIILGNSGMGLFGFAGLFGMNYERKIPSESIGAMNPDLAWLISTDGKPESSDYWTANIDSWAFGAGVRLGSLDGGYLLNLCGMMILELPGPRFLVTVKLQILEKMPPQLKDAGLNAGIIGLLDLDFLNHQVIIGVVANYEFKKLITIQIPIEIYFRWEDNPAAWHVYFGTIEAPCSAKILGIVKGSGYFMISGQPITLPSPTETQLPAVAVAMGVAASVLWGSEKYAVYLKVALSANLGMSFAPHVFIVGNIHIEGEFRLIIISIGVSGDFTITAGKIINEETDPPSIVYSTHLQVNVCGHIKVIFFSITKCVGFSIGTKPPEPSPPPLIRQMYLQSFASVIAQGQGGARPIDASLGYVVHSDDPSLELLTVPIDSVPVLQMQYGVDATGAEIGMFTNELRNCLTDPGADGVDLGGGVRAKYILKSISLEAKNPLTGEVVDPPLSPPPDGVQQEVPVAWRPNRPGRDTSLPPDTSQPLDPSQSLVDLALFSRNPENFNAAIERSAMLTQQLLSHWGDICDPIAPPASVFWTFCGQRPGPSPDGWTLYGTPSPDPEGTVRTYPVPTRLRVEQPDFTADEHLLVDIGSGFGIPPYVPAMVITARSGPDYPLPGTRRVTGVAVELPELYPIVITTTVEQQLVDTFAGKVQKLVGKGRWLRFGTGVCTSVRLLMALNKPLDGGNKSNPEHPWVVVRERDAGNAFLREWPLSSLNPTRISSLSDLPASWRDPAGLWYQQAGFVAKYLLGEPMVIYLVNLEPGPSTSYIEVAVTAPPESQLEKPSGTPRPSPPPLVLLIGAIEALPSCETSRATDSWEMRDNKIQELESYLNGNTPVPLLRSNTEYTITVKYEVKKPPASETSSPKSQAYTFKTDNSPPESLDPWVLCTSPYNNEEYVFYEDLIKIVFNDVSIIPLFREYGYNLQVVLRAADGFEDPYDPADVSEDMLQPTDGVGTAMYDALRQMIQEGIDSGRLSCFGSFDLSFYQNPIFSPDVKLRKLMAYTLDLKRVPNTIDSDVPPPDPTPEKPLFRRCFSTSRFRNMQELAENLKSTAISHRFLANKLDFKNFTVGAPPQVVPDQEIQKAFTDAGEQALPAPEKNSVIIYWAPGVNGSLLPVAILIDCIEPLWRYRAEPRFEKPDPENDPSFEIVTIDPTIPALEVIAMDGSAVSGFLHSPGGTRTIAVLSQPATPGESFTVTLALRRPKTETYGINEEIKATITTLEIGPDAPWEDDHV